MNPRPSASLQPRPSQQPASLPNGRQPPCGRLVPFPAPTLPSEDRRIRLRLLLEFLILFAALPAAVFLHPHLLGGPLRILWMAFAVCLILLLRDPAFDRRRLWNAAPLRRQLPRILALFAAGVVVLTVWVHQYEPRLFLQLIRSHPRAWAMLMLSYPIASVYPQGLVYRAFIFHRYRRLSHPRPETDSPLLILLSAVAFSSSHIVFHNGIALALTLPGGILFARRYADTRSLLVSGVEHVLYGSLLFTLGLGPFFGVHLR